jgi:DNA-binding CsgD family transcriptional regulator
MIAMGPQLVDRIYECAFVPERWTGVLGELAEVAGARAGFLFVSNEDVHHWTSSTQVGIEALRPLVDSGWIARSERFARFQAARHSGFLRDDDIYTRAEMKSDPFYRDILYPRGLGWAAGMAFPLPTGERLSVNLEREYARGPVEREAIERLDALRPHLARSGLLAARLQLERARAAGEALARIGLAAAVLGPMGKVLAANALIEAMSERVQWRADDRLSLKDRRADRSLRGAMDAIGAPGAPGVRSFPVRDGEGRSVMVAHLVPMRLSARDIFLRAAALLVLTPLAAPQAPPVELVRSLFDLTPAEARVARDLAGGKTVNDIASDGAVSLNTIRAHVRGVLQKTGCSRQVDVITLLAGIAAVRLPEPD